MDVCLLSCVPDRTQAYAHTHLQLHFHDHTHLRKNITKHCTQAALDDAASTATSVVSDLRHFLGSGPSIKASGGWEAAMAQAQDAIAQALGRVTAALIQELAQVCVCACVCVCWGGLCVYVCVWALSFSVFY